MHWSPLLAQTAGTGPSVRPPGCLCQPEQFRRKKLDLVGGYTPHTTAHGAAVASLFAAKQDGVGVMGMAPNAHLELDNPFDSTGTADWSDVSNGIDGLFDKKATVMNASLGVPGRRCRTNGGEHYDRSGGEGQQALLRAGQSRRQ